MKSEENMLRYERKSVKNIIIVHSQEILWKMNAKWYTLKVNGRIEWKTKNYREKLKIQNRSWKF